MTTTWNPVVHLQHAWSKLTTIWGKIALILFYAFVWLTVLSCIITLIVPGSQGMDCIIDTVADPWSRVLFIGMARTFSLFLLGFLLYADVGGLNIKNVGFVTFFCVLSSVIIGIGCNTQLENIDSAKFEAVGECLGQYAAYMWVWTALILAALVFCVLEERLGDQGSEAERQPLSSQVV